MRPLFGNPTYQSPNNQNLKLKTNKKNPQQPTINQLPQFLPNSWQFKKTLINQTPVDHRRKRNRHV